MKESPRYSLPNGQPRGATLFLTYRIYGSLPREAMKKLAYENHRLKTEPPRPNESPRDRALREDKALFAIADDALDSTRRNPQWLSNDSIAQAILENLFFHAEKSYSLWAFTVMPNHVHVLLEPLNAASANLKEEDASTVSQITHTLKSFTAHRANEILKHKGAFWEAASYDQWIRDASEFARTVEYIERNPVKARLVNSPMKWRWSSATFARAADGTCLNQIAKLG